MESGVLETNNSQSSRCKTEWKSVQSKKSQIVVLIKKAMLLTWLFLDTIINQQKFLMCSELGLVNN